MKHYFANTTPDVTAMEAAHNDFVRRLSGECMVLLENNGVLPLTSAGMIALYGNGARATVKGGTGSGDVNSRFTVNIEQGLEEAGFTVTSKDWLDAQDAAAKAEITKHQQFLANLAEERHQDIAIVSILCDHFIPTALAPFQKADGDTAVYVLARNSGEGCDRSNVPGDYQLTDEETVLLTELGKNYKNVILLLNVGGIINAAAIRAIPGISAVLLISQSGNMGGNIVSDVLLGKSIPSGRLTDTWAAKYENYPSSAGFSHNNGNLDDEYYTDGIYVGYRYFDSFNITPIYPFGYGLNYTEFRMETLDVAASETNVTVSVRVINTGSRYAGREVVQIYGSAPARGLEKPMQVLAAFAKTRLLQPGESQTLHIQFPLTNLESYDPKKAAYVLEGGTYTIRIGKNSRSTSVAAILTLDEDAVTRKVKNICPLDEDFHEISAAGIQPWTYPEEIAQKASAKVIALKAAQIPCVTVNYAGEPSVLPTVGSKSVITMDDIRAGRNTVEEMVSQLTVAEMADLCVGAARDGDNVIGSASSAVPGAAGETSMLLKYRGIRDMTNADGPAGLRLYPHFRTDCDGNVLPGAVNFGGMAEGYGEKKNGETDYYQYCTAIPIAWLLASSWDLELIENIGRMVGEEMEKFGVRVWLAPGMNIHRNPLCGRNFEYYSEDPLLSGLCAAADVRGVQKNRGVGTSIKHFFANNQEDRRMFCNAHIKERAIREIYLRNFGICIQAAQPMTIMTSYNLINGVHAANCYDSITCYAREECGFRGYVMTDWYSSNHAVAAMFTPGELKYSSSVSPMCVKAGNDVQMPGCEKNISDIIEAAENGSLPIGSLQDCCVRLLKTDLMCASFEDAGPYNTGMALTSFITVE